MLFINMNVIRYGVELYLYSLYKIKIGNRIGSVMVSMLASRAIDCGYELRSC